MRARCCCTSGDPACSGAAAAARSAPRPGRLRATRARRGRAGVPGRSAAVLLHQLAQFGHRDVAAAEVALRSMASSCRCGCQAAARARHDHRKGLCQPFAGRKPVGQGNRRGLRVCRGRQLLAVEALELGIAGASSRRPPGAAVGLVRLRPAPVTARSKLGMVIPGCCLGGLPRCGAAGAEEQQPYRDTSVMRGLVCIVPRRSASWFSHPASAAANMTTKSKQPPPVCCKRHCRRRAPPSPRSADGGPPAQPGLARGRCRARAAATSSPASTCAPNASCGSACSPPCRTPVSSARNPQPWARPALRLGRRSDRRHQQLRQRPAALRRGGGPAAHRDPVVAAVSCAPEQALYHAVRGGGARRDGRRLRIGRGRLDDGCPDRLPVASRPQELEFLARLQQGGGRLRSFGCTVAQILDVAMGRLDANVQQQGRIWDFAAAGLVLPRPAAALRTGAGSRCSPCRDLRPRPYRHGRSRRQRPPPTAGLARGRWRPACCSARVTAGWNRYKLHSGATASTCCSHDAAFALQPAAGTSAADPTAWTPFCTNGTRGGSILRTRIPIAGRGKPAPCIWSNRS